MFVYTVYGIPGGSRREPGRSVQPVSKAEAVLPTRPSWVVQRENSERPDPGYQAQKAARGYIQTLRDSAETVRAASPAPSGEQREPVSRAGDFFLGNAPLVVSYRQPQPVPEPDFTGSLDRLMSLQVQAMAY